MELHEYFLSRGNRQGGLVAEVFKSKETSRCMIIELENIHARVLVSI